MPLSVPVVVSEGRGVVGEGRGDIYVASPPPWTSVSLGLALQWSPLDLHLHLPPTPTPSPVCEAVGKRLHLAELALILYTWGTRKLILQTVGATDRVV